MKTVTAKVQVDSYLQRQIKNVSQNLIDSGTSDLMDFAIALTDLSQQLIDTFPMTAKTAKQEAKKLQTSNAVRV